MDKIIDRLSDIEKAAGSLMDDAGVRKKALAKEMEEKTAAFVKPEPGNRAESLYTREN